MSVRAVTTTARYRIGSGIPSFLAAIRGSGWVPPNRIQCLRPSAETIVYRGRSSSPTIPSVLRASVVLFSFFFVWRKRAMIVDTIVVVRDPARRNMPWLVGFSVRLLSWRPVGIGL